MSLRGVILLVAVISVVSHQKNLFWNWDFKTFFFEIYALPPIDRSSDDHAPEGSNIPRKKGIIVEASGIPGKKQNIVEASGIPGKKNVVIKASGIPGKKVTIVDASGISGKKQVIVESQSSEDNSPKVQHVILASNIPWIFYCKFLISCKTINFWNLM